MLLQQLPCLFLVLVKYHRGPEACGKDSCSWLCWSDLLGKIRAAI